MKEVTHDLIGRGLGGVMAVTYLHQDITLAYLGVAAPVIVASCLGTFAAVALIEKEETRKQFLAVCFMCVVVGCAFTSLLAEFLKWKYEVQLEPKHMAAIAIPVSFFCRPVLPAVVARVPGWLDNLKIPFFSSNKKTNGE